MARVTDQLLAAAAAAGKGKREEALGISMQLRQRHLDTASEVVGRQHAGEVAHRLNEKFNALDDLLRGIYAVGELTPRTNDLVVSFGERASSIIVAHCFRHRGLSATHVDARDCIVTDSHYGKAAPLEDAD